MIELSKRRLEEMAGKEEPCPECTLNAGTSVAFQICKVAGTNCEDIQTKLFDGEITVQQAVDDVKARLKEEDKVFEVGLVEEVEEAMREKWEEQTTDGPACVSVFVKEKMTRQIDEWVDDRKTALNEAVPDSKFAVGTKELIANLEKTKTTIQNMKTCES